MQSQPHRYLILVLAAVLLVSRAAPQQRSNKRTVSADGLYSFHLPASWSIDVNEPQRLSIANCARSDVAEGGLLPPNGAAIIVAKAPAQVKNVEEWRQRADPDAHLISDLQVPCPAGAKNKRDCVQREVRTEMAPGVFYRIVTIYFSIKGHLLRATLVLNEAYPNVDKSRRAFNEFLSSINPG